MKCWEKRPEDRPTFTHQLKDLSTILELTAEYMHCLAFDPMPTTIVSNDTVSASTTIATNNDLSSSEVSSGEEKDVMIINPLCYSEDESRDANVTAHTTGDVSPCDNDKEM